MAVTYSITGGLTHLSGNPIQITLTASAALNHHKLVLKVICKTMAGVELIGSPFIEEIAPKNLQARFDISGLVDYPADYGFEFPIVGAFNPHDLLAIKVTFEVGETWIDGNGDRQESFTPGAETIKVLKGKMLQYELSLLNAANKSFASEYIEGGKFLTHQPDYQRISPEHICMLWYLGRWSNAHTVSMNLKVITDRHTYLINHGLELWEITGLIECEFSAAHQGVVEMMQWGEKILSYEFWITDRDYTGADVSEHRHYLIDNDYYEQSETIYAVNPFSGIDMHWFTGSSKQGLVTESETAVRPVEVGAGTEQGSIKTISAKGRRTWEINSGSRSKKEMLVLRDLLESKQVWIVDKATNKLVPVIVESGDFTMYDSKQDLLSLTITLKEAH